MGFFQQTKYLIRKNYQHKRRNKRETFQEILIPLWWLLILLAVRLGVRRTEEPAITDSEIPTVAISTPGPTHVKPQNGSIKPTVGYVTNNISSARAVMELVKNHSGKAVNYLEFNSTDSLVQFYKEYSESKKIGVGLEFGKGKHEGLAYTIRIAKKSMPSPETKVTGQGKCHDMTKALSDPYNCPANSYFILGTATLQASVDAAITKVVANLPYYTVPNITAKMMPKTSFTPSVEGFSNIVSIYLVIAFTPYVTVLLVNLVQEKEKKLKELMRIMGMWDSAYWFSWVITYAVVMLVAVLILNAIAVPAGIFGKSNFGVMVILFYLYGLTVIMFALMWTPFFKNAKTAGFAASVTTILFSVIPLAAKNVSSSAMWALSLLSPTAFAFSLGQAVNIPAGLQFSNLSTEGSFPVINVIIMLIVDIILYFLLALYFDSVIPAEYGQRKPPYFIFMPSFWKNLIGRDTKNKSPERQLSDLQQEHSEDIEEMPAEMRGNGAVRIHKLRKEFHGKEDIVAVDGVSMEIYEGHVTALLGHNGAGKTTLIAMVTGMVPPSGGSALVYGMDITDPNQMQNIRKIIGVCHQQNVLFDFLNVREHLELYCGLKQITGEAMDNTVKSLMKEIDLKDQEETLSKDLSGGQKRKLCVGIALIGDPKVLILDEPTSGMDPYSRRLMWSLLQEKCKDKVVLLTTHFMDEADILAEYKAVLSKGKVRCAGSSLFLKNRFGIGYHLNMALTDDCDTERLTNLVQRKVQGAQVIRRHGREMALALPMEQVSHFSELFQALEEHNNTTEGCTAPLLGVTSYGVSMTSLEEVYLQLEDTNEEETESEAKDETQEPNNYGAMENTQNLLHVEPVEGVTVQDGAVKVSGSASALHTTGVELNTRDSPAKPVWKAKQQLLGLLKTRFLLTIRSPLKLFFMVIVPPILLVIGLVISRTGTKSGAASGPQPLLISPELYIKPASSESYASKALLQNSTTSAIENVMEYFTNYKVGTELVSSISGLLNSSSHALWNLGFVIQQFPVLFNASQSTPNLASSFEMRYNDTTVHSVPLGVHMISSVVHMNALKSQGKMPYPLETTILPFPGLKPEFTYDNTAFISVLLIGMALAIIPGGFAIEVVAFRQEKIRHILRVSGVPSVVYWLQFFLADATIFLIPVVLMLILIPAFQLPSLSPAPAVGCIILAVLLFLPAAILFSYAFSFLFSKWDTCQQVMPSVFNMGGFLPFAAVAMVDMIANPDIAIILHYVFVSLLPPYTVFGALYYIDRVYRFAYIQAIFRSNGESVNVEVTASQYFTWTQHNGIPAALIAPVLHTIILGLLVYYLDQRDVGAKTQLSSCVSNSRGNAVDRNPSLRRSSSFKPPHHKDEDVKQEKERITSRGEASIEQSSLAVLVKGLWKRFKTSKKPKVVVKDLYFGVEKGEVFGLLGPNGAGKTTTLNMITGDVHPTRGKIFVAGYDVSKDPFDAFQRMGYCPQIDALWETITLEEHLEVYAKIRGVPWDEIKTVVDHYMSALKITEHAKKRAKELSGGTKRKVSFAMAMLGDPELLLLDEPSTGMDPSARRFLWNTISKNVRGTRGAILTTHSMEEADALCSRVGIMVKGQLKCLGSTQHLKSTYGSGYTLEIKLAQSQASETSTGDLTERLHAYVTELLPGATQSEMFGGRVIYKIPREDVAALSTIFDALERGKQVIGIEEYSFSQSTLEQVFLEFAKEQDDDRTGAQDKEPDEQNGEPHEQNNTENNHVMV